MRVVQAVLRDIPVLTEALLSLSPLVALQPNLLLVFGPVDRLGVLAPWLAEQFPNATRIGCSVEAGVTAAGVHEQDCILTALRFERTALVAASTVLAERGDSRAAGERLGKSLRSDGLRAVLLFGPGIGMNGSALLEGINEVLGNGNAVPVVGGVASRTRGGHRTGVLSDSGFGSENVVAVGLCGDALRFGFASFGGWSSFGPTRKVTRCDGNVLYELDGEPALEIYKRYLGEYAKDLPMSGLYFPFAMLDENFSDVGLIRATLDIDESAGSLRLADEINPRGWLRLMHASTDRLVDGAEKAAEVAQNMHGGERGSHRLVLMVSCVGRKQVMGARVDEEIEAVADVFGPAATLAGLYSWGEVSPMEAGQPSRLHNQTVMVACFDEVLEQIDQVARD